MTGTGTAPGLPACGFSLTGSGTLANTDTLPVTYSGTTCLGPMQGTVTLRRASFVTVNAPTLVSPGDGTTVSSVRPTLVAADVSHSGPIVSLTYLFQVAIDAGFTANLLEGSVAEQSGQTSYTLSQDLARGVTYYWRVRAADPARTGPWSATWRFTTPAPPAPTPSPTPPPVYPSNGPDVVRYVAQRYPERLVAGVSLDVRKANMAFLRDRVIETGICGGMDLALNLKRGGPEVSVDYVTYNKNGRWIGVDIGAASNDTSIRLQLQWMENPDDPYATPKAYFPRPTCS